MATLKTCRKCGVDLVPEENWTIGNVRVKNYLCRTCANEANKERGAQYWRERDLMKRYGITQEDYDALLEDQDGGCKICGWVPPEDKNLHVDHCHDTNEVRGLLCQSCNSLLGYARDNQEVLASSIAYLEYTRSSKEPDPVWHPNPLIEEDPEAYFTVSEVLDLINIRAQGEDLI